MCSIVNGRIDKDNIILKLNGEVAVFENGVLTEEKEIVDTNELLIDGNVSKDIGELVLKDRIEHYNDVKKLNNIILEELKKYPKIHINSTNNSIPYTINFSIKDIRPETLIRALSSKEVYISTKSACSSSDSMSNSIYALTHDKELSNNSLRISLSYKTTKEEVKEFLEIFKECYQKLDLRKDNENN